MDKNVIAIINSYLEDPLANLRLLSGALALSFRMGYLMDFKWAAFDLKFIPKIIDSMRLARDEPEIQEKGLAAIGTLCSNCRGNKNDFVDLDGASHVADAMDAHPDVRTIHEAALCCLQFFSEATDRE